MKVYQKLAYVLCALENCKASNNTEWIQNWEAEIVRLNALMPHGSGLDGSTDLILEESSGERLTFRANYHHMNEGGYYDGWTNHKVIVKPSLMSGILIRVTGPNRNDIKEYIGDLFADALCEEYTLS